MKKQSRKKSKSIYSDDGDVQGLFEFISHDLLLVNNPEPSTIIHELMHARSKRLNISDKRIKDMENKIEDGLCETLALIIHKTLYNDITPSIAYPEYVSEIINISKMQNDISMFNVCMGLLLIPNGKRFKAINNIIKFEVENKGLTNEEINSIKLQVSVFF